jgi:hypothetical protein
MPPEWCFLPQAAAGGDGARECLDALRNHVSERDCCGRLGYRQRIHEAVRNRIEGSHKCREEPLSWPCQKPTLLYRKAGGWTTGVRPYIVQVESRQTKPNEIVCAGFGLSGKEACVGTIEHLAELAHGDRVADRSNN